MITVNQVCGDMDAYYQDTSSGYPEGYVDQRLVTGRAAYGIFGDTSAAAPKVSGSAILFKQWLLEHSDLGTADLPGAIYAGLLNMTDRYTDSDTLRAQPIWGLGRFGLRAYGEASGATFSHFKVGKVELVEDESVTIPVGPFRGTFDRLDAAVWWYEPMTGSTEEKPAVWAFLVVRQEDGSGYEVLDWTNNYNGIGREQHVSLTFSSSAIREWEARRPCLDKAGPYFVILLLTDVDPGDSEVSRELYYAISAELGTTSGSVCDSGVSHLVRCSSRLKNWYI